MKLSIRVKLIAFTICIILLVGGAISLYSIYQGRERILHTFRDDALQTTTLLSGALINDLYFLDISSLRHSLRNARVNPNVSYTYVLDHEGVVVTDGTRENPLAGRRLADDFSAEMLQSKGWLARVDGEMLKVGGPLLIPDGGSLGYLQIGYTLEHANAIVRDTTWASLNITMLSVFIGAALAIIVATGFSRPIESIVAAAQTIGRGHLDTRLTMKRGDEFGTLADSINRMAEALELRAAETKRNLEGIRALHEIDKAISSSLELKQVLHVLLEKIDLFLPYSTATVRLFNKESGLLEPVACRNLDEREWKVGVWRPGRGPANVAFESKRPLIIRNCLEDPRVRDPEFFRKHRLVSYLGVPMFAKEEILGVLSFYTQEEHEFTSEEMDFLVALAGQAAVAIHNSEVYEEMAKLASDLSRSNRVKDEFLSVMSHELRTPLNVVMGYTGMIKDGLLGEVNAEQERALEKVISRARDQLGMISSILQATQMEAEGVRMHKHQVPLKSFLDDLRSSYAIASGKELSVVWDYSADLPVINTDTEKLKHILHNLINNAIKFTETGTVTVSARCFNGADLRQENARRASGNDRDDLVQFQVADTGIGVAKEHQSMIFERFRQVDSSETRKYGGVGVGLYIVKKFAELLGGKVEVESEPGKGSTFTVTVPRELPVA